MYEMETLWWVLTLLVGISQAASNQHEVAVTLNTVHCVRITSDRFISISVPPSFLLTANNCSSATLSMLQGLSPAYLRVAGQETRRIGFKSKIQDNSEAFVFTESQWAGLNQLAAEARLSLIMSLNPGPRVHGTWDPSNALQLLSRSDQLGYNPVWQFGYVMPDVNLTSFTGSDVGRDVVRLRKILDSFPRYQRTAILGPDIVACDKCNYKHFLRDFLLETSGIIDVITLQLKPQKNNRREVEDMLESLSRPMEKLAKVIAVRDDSVGTGGGLYNHLWIAESGLEGYTGGFSDALMWALRLGYAARLGYQVVFRHPAQLLKPTPDYWVSLLYHNLVGRVVLSTFPLSGDSSLTVFAHCTAYHERPSQSALDPEWEYEHGAVTVWGVNTAPESIKLTLHAGMRQEHVHVYTLTEDTWEDTELGNTLLNGQLLHLTHGALPRLSPRIRPTGRSLSVTVPGHSVFFIILPDIKVRACLSYPARAVSEDLTNPQWQSLPTIVDIPIDTRIKHPPTSKKQDDYILERGGIFETIEMLGRNGGIFKTKLRHNPQFYVREHIHSIINDAKEKIGLQKDSQEMSDDRDSSGEWSSEMNEKPGTKFVTFSDNNWLKKLSQVNSSDDVTKKDLLTSADLVLTDKDIHHERDSKYSLLTTAILGKRNEREHSASVTLSQAKTSGVMRFKRSEDNGQIVKSQDTEVTPPNRRISLLRRNRVLGNMQVSKLPEEPKLKPPYHVPLLDTTVNRYKKQNSNFKTDSKYLNQANTLPNNNQGIGNDMPKSGIEKVESGSIHYLPGEFYETLGSLKLDSNVSLRDVEDPHEAVTLVKKKLTKCKDSKGSLDVRNKPINKHQEDNKVLKNAVEERKQNYNTADIIKKEFDVSSDDSNTSKDDSMKCCCGKENFEEMIQPKFEDTLTTSNDSQLKKSQKLSFQNENSIKGKGNSVLNSQAEIPRYRMKREIKSINKDPLNIAQSTLAEEQAQSKGETDLKSDFSEETQLRAFLEELTAEGEQLLKSLDEDQTENSILSECHSDINLRATTTTLPVVNYDLIDHNKLSTVDDQRLSSKSYLKNNLIIDRLNKPRRKYSIQLESSTSTFTSPDSIADHLVSSNEDNLKEIDLFEVTTSSSITSKISEEVNKNKPTEIVADTDQKPQTEETNSFYTKYLNGSEQNIVFTLPQTSSKFNISKKYPSNFTTSYVLPNNDSVFTVSFASHYSNNPTSTSSISTFPRKPIPVMTINRENVSNGPITMSNFSISSLNSQGVRQSNTENMSTTLDVSNHKNENLNSFSTNLLPNSYVNTTLLATPALLNLLYNMSKPTNTDNIKTEGKESDSSSDTNIKTTEKNPLWELMQLNKHKERIEAFNSILRKTREKILSLPNSPEAPIRLIKREIHLEKGLTNKMPKKTNLRSENSILKHNNKYNTNTLQNSGMAKYLEEKMLKSSLTYESDLNHRLERQLNGDYDNGKESKNYDSTVKNVKDPYSQTLTPNKGTEKQLTADVVIPPYLSPINKWIIPLSNNTENIVLNNKMFPVKLYGILSDNWVKQINRTRSNDIMSDSKRKPRSLQYPCIRDNFNDYDMAYQDTKSTKNINIRSKGISDQNSKYLPEAFRKTSQMNQGMEEMNSNVKSTQVLPLSISEYKNRPKRSIRDAIEGNEVEIKALLTNEIVKEGPLNDISDGDHSDTAFSSMLQQTLSRTLSNKTGMDKMYELAKQYQKTNPNSLEIFDRNGKRKDNQAVKGDNNKIEDNNKSLEELKMLKKNSSNSSENIPVRDFENESTVSSITSSNQSQTTEKIVKISKKDLLTKLMARIHDFFKVITSVIKKNFPSP